jgi:DNA replication protein DnaC
MAKSSYCSQALAISKADKYADLRKEIKAAFSESSSHYGYRKIHSFIKSAGTIVSEKVVRRIMEEEQLIVQEKHNIIVMGAAGNGKSYMGCAFGVSACRNYYTVKYIRLPGLLNELAVARGEGI